MTGLMTILMTIHYPTILGWDFLRVATNYDSPNHIHVRGILNWLRIVGRLLSFLWPSPFLLHGSDLFHDGGHGHGRQEDRSDLRRPLGM